MALAGGTPELKREDPFMLEAGWSAAVAPNLAVYNGSSPHHLTSQTCVFAVIRLFLAVQTEQQRKPIAIRNKRRARVTYAFKYCTESACWDGS